MQLVISQVRKLVLDWGPEAKTIWGRRLPKIIPLINGQLDRLYGFPPSEITLEYVPKWKVARRETQVFIPGNMPGTTQEATLGEEEELEMGQPGY